MKSRPIVHHVVNAALVSGPETLVFPNLQNSHIHIEVVVLNETRAAHGSKQVSEYLRSLNYKIHEFEISGRIDLKAILKLRRFWKNNPPDIIHSHGPKASFFSVLAGKSLKNKKIKFITTHHGVRANDGLKNLKLHELIYEKIAIPFHDLCLTVCSSDLELLFARGVPRRKLRLHLNGVDRPLVNREDLIHQRESIREKWGIKDKKKFIIGVVGRLAVEKQHDLILNAFKTFHESNPDSLLVCFGTGPLEETVKELTKHLGLDEAVLWAGYRRTLGQEFSGFDVLLSMSKAEGLPINLIEAGWAGIPVVAQGVDGVLDLIPNEEYGILLPNDCSAKKCADKLSIVHNEQKKSELMAKNFQNRVQNHFSKKAWVERLEKIYEEFLT